MIDDKHIHGIDNQIQLRLQFIQIELDYLNRQSRKQYILNDPDELMKIKTDYEKYCTEMELLNSLSDFYSENV